MKFSDTFRIALRSIRNNLGRTVLTASIVAVVSALVMFLLLIGVSFRENLLAVAKYAFHAQGADYTMSGQQTLNEHNNLAVGAITEEEYALLRKHAAAHSEVCGDDVAHSNMLGLSESLSDRFFFYVGNFRGFEDTTVEDGWWIQPPYIPARSFSSVPKDLVFREGRSWTPDDAASDAIFVSRSVKRMCENAGHIVNVGDEVLLLDMGKQDRLASFTIQGFFEDSGSELFYIGIDKLFELGRLNRAIYVQSVTMHFDAPAENYDYDATYASMRQFTDETTAALDQDYSMQGFPGADLFVMLFSDITRRFTNSFVDQMRLIDVVSGIIIAVFALLALLVLLLSVGSVANSVLISVDKNKKFFGMMKAVGLNKRGLRRLVFAELLLIVAAGVAVGIALLYALYPVANSIIVSLFGFMWGSMLPFSVSAVIPVWLPLSAALFFLLLTMLFSRGSIRRIAAQDVMITLSEAA